MEIRKKQLVRENYYSFEIFQESDVYARIYYFDFFYIKE